MAESRTKAAREKSAVTALRMVEDLDMIESPEGLDRNQFIFNNSFKFLF